MKDNPRNNIFILALTEEEAEKLRLLASENDHAPSRQAYIIIRNYLKNVEVMTAPVEDENGNRIIHI